jgi:hypothetical protein
MRDSDDEANPIHKSTRISAITDRENLFWAADQTIYDQIPLSSS